MRSKHALRFLLAAAAVGLAPRGAAAALAGAEPRHVLQLGLVGAVALVVAAWRFKKGDAPLGMLIWVAAASALVAFVLYPPPGVARLFM